MKYCQKCGTYHPDPEAYCSKCGTQLKEEIKITREHGVKVDIAANGKLGMFKINGVDLSECISSLEYRHTGQEFPTLVIEIIPDTLNRH